MAQTQVGIVYNPTTLEIMRVVVPDDDGQLDDPAWTDGGGLSMLRLSNDDYFSAASSSDGLAAIIAQATGSLQSDSGHRR